MNTKSFNMYHFIHHLRQDAPIVHCYTNMVTVNQVANALLAIGAKPIMSVEAEEFSQIAQISQAFYLNIGTLKRAEVSIMLAAIEVHSALGHPIVFDPVGVGASSLRTDVALEILASDKITAIRGNASEIRFLLGQEGRSSGVDVSSEDESDNYLEKVLTLAQEAAQKWHTFVSISGPIDVVHDGQQAYVINNGHEMMKYITGTGCQLTSLLGAFLSIQKSIEAVVNAVVAYDLAGEIAHASLLEREGPGTMQVRLFDALYYLDDAQIVQRGQVSLIESM